MRDSLHIHLVAICGTAMGALAVMLKALGHRVTGSDEHVYPPMSTVLLEQQIPVFKRYDAANLEPEPDLVVIGNAVSRGNPEAEAVLERKIKYASMPETLKSFFLWDRKPVVVTGTHGKTTITAMLAWVLTEAGLEPSYIIGGVPNGWTTGARLGSGDLFILEGDEYDSAFFDKRAKFLHYLPDTVIINNIEFDHADIYDSLDDIVLSFRRLVNVIPSNGLLIGSAEDEHIGQLGGHAFCRVDLIGQTPEARWSASQIVVSPRGSSFDLYEHETLRTRLSIRLYGIHNVKNTLAVVAVARHYGISWLDITRSLETFPGVKRRLEIRGKVNGITVYDDFAHHPTAVKATLGALREAYPDQRIWAIFEPRTATTIRSNFQEEYGTAFDDVDYVLVAPVFLPDKAPEGNRFSVQKLVKDLRQRGLEADAMPGVTQIASHLSEHTLPGDHVVFMSNGGFGDVHEKTLSQLNQQN